MWIVGPACLPFLSLSRTRNRLRAWSTIAFLSDPFFLSLFAFPSRTSHYITPHHAQSPRTLSASFLLHVQYLTSTRTLVICLQFGAQPPTLQNRKFVAITHPFLTRANMKGPDLGHLVSGLAIADSGGYALCATSLPLCFTPLLAIGTKKKTVYTTVFPGG